VSAPHTVRGRRDERRRRDVRRRRAVLLAAVIVILLFAVGAVLWLTAGHDGAGSPSAASTAGGSSLGFIDAIVLGVVEGVTEYLPISSTGHLLLTEHLLGLTGDEQLTTAADSYALAIQFGAIFAVILLYWRRLVSILRGLVGRDPAGRHLLVVLIASTIPAVIIALIGEKFIKGYLFALWPVTAAWLVGGVVILLVARHDRQTNHRPDQGARIEDLTVRNAVIIGLAQSVAMWPGVSRSLVTILGGRLVGLSTVAAVEYSFLLGLVTLTGASLFEAVTDGGAIVATFGIAMPLLGVVVAFVAAAIAIEWMVTYLSRHTLALFGWYRIGLAAIVAVLILTSVI
jgi:undecaprenyl-diphosphatase